MRSDSGGFIVYLYCVGDGRYQVFIKNNSSDADFVRLAIGYAKRSNGKYTMQFDREWIISPLTRSDDHVYIADITKQSMAGRRIWVAFEGAKRSSGKKNSVVGTFIALASAPSKWHATVGSLTNFHIRAINPLGTISQTPNLHELAQIT